MEEYLTNWNFIVTGITVSSIGLISSAVYFNDRRNATNLAFFLFAIITMSWSASNYLYYSSTNAELSLLTIKTILFLGTWHAYTFFLFCNTIPKKKFVLSHYHLYVVLPLVTAISLIALSPLTFSKTVYTQTANTLIGPDNTIGLAMFSLLVVYLILHGIIILIRKTIGAQQARAKQFKLISLGTGITFFLILTYNVIFPAVLAEPGFIQYSASFILPFVAFTAYAIVRHQLFNVKTVAITALIIILSSISVMQLFFATSTFHFIYAIFEFFLILIFGVLLLRSVSIDIEQKEKIEKLAKKLASYNKHLREIDHAKSEFVSIASHQLRSPLTAIRGYASMLLEGSYGKFPAKAQKPLEHVAESARMMALSIEDYLNVSRIESGNMQYELADFNLYELVNKICDDLRPEAIKHGLLLLCKSNLHTKAIVHADQGKTQQIVHNLINNALKYTTKGTITAYVHDNQSTNQIFVEIIDTGIGMSTETQNNIFHKFKRASNANTVNVHGTGLGLYVAKRIATAMDGDVVGYSAGEGKGSHFILNLPLQL
jgi:signal transduction histidine kinase